jgi:LmbE family N-acetylglucosaminyl deacetylase
VSRISQVPLEVQERLIREAQQAAPAIFDTFRFAPDDWLKASPTPIPERPETHGRFFLRGLPLRECVWIAENEWCSGQPDHNLHFGTVERWLRDRPNPEDWANHAQFVSPGHFHSGAYSRCLDNVLYRRFLVLEADKLSPDWQENKCLSSAIVRWAVQAYSRFGLKLFAVIDSAKKSAHHWLTWPRCSPLEWAKLKITLVALGIDPQIFDLCRVVRMPGYFRSWAPEQPARSGSSSPSPARCGWTQLLYLNPQVLLPFDNLASSRLTHPDHQPTFQATLGPDRSSAGPLDPLTSQA